LPCWSRSGIDFIARCAILRTEPKILGEHALQHQFQSKWMGAMQHADEHAHGWLHQISGATTALFHKMMFYC
jgi:hypothetical protein